MEQTEYLELLKEIQDIRQEYNSLHAQLRENQELLIQLLKINNNKTDTIYDVTIKDKSTEQQLKDFGMNVLANIAGNAINTPTIIKLK